MKCKKCCGNLILIPSSNPWHDEYWICEDCESTFCYDYEFLKKEEIVKKPRRLKMDKDEDEISPNGFEINPEVEMLRYEIFLIWKKENKELHDSFSWHEKVSLEGMLYNTNPDAYRPSFMKYIKYWADKIIQARNDIKDQV